MLECHKHSVSCPDLTSPCTCFTHIYHGLLHSAISKVQLSVTQHSKFLEKCYLSIKGNNFPVYTVSQLWKTAYSHRHYHNTSNTYVPVLSTVSERTAPLWHSILTNGSFWLGDHRLTVPFGWPKWMMALWGFCAITSSLPDFVQIAATSFPTDTSRYCRKPVALWESWRYVRTHANTP